MQYQERTKHIVTEGTERQKDTELLQRVYPSPLNTRIGALQRTVKGVGAPILGFRPKRHLRTKKSQASTGSSFPPAALKHRAFGEGGPDKVFYVEVPRGIPSEFCE